ncbi:MAG TPA: protease modulator HflC [Parvularculaceae bacterium]|nr:protease modulator HflC [Parvularculaceae bacterium]
MAKNQYLAALVVGIVLLFVVADSCLFSVRETENAIVVVLGDPQGVVTKAGLHPKLPWASIIKIDKRNLGYNLDRPMEITDVNQERLTVDAFARYHIVEPLKYYQSFAATGAHDPVRLRESGQDAIRRIMQNALRQTLGEVTIGDIVTTQRAELMQRIAKRMEQQTRKFGVEIIDVKINRADYPDDIQQTVYNQMISARQEEAQLIRSEGKREATRIRAEADRRRTEILANANRQSLEIRGQAEAARNCIFAGAYDGLPVTIAPMQEGKNDVAKKEQKEEGDGKQTQSSARVTCTISNASAPRDPERAEFFAFYRSLQAYENALKGDNTTILLSPKSEFFQYFNNLEGKSQ